MRSHLRTENTMQTKKRKKILLLTKWYPNRYDPQFGVFIRKQVHAISRQSDILVFYGQSDDQVMSGKTETVIHREAGITEYCVYYSKDTSVFSVLVNAVRYYQAWKKTWDEIRKEHGIPDIVHAYILLRPVLLAWWMSKRYRIPYVVSEQWSGYTNGRFQQLPWLIRRLSVYFTNHAAARTVVSRFLRDRMVSAGFQPPLEIIPNIIDQTAADAMPEIKRFKAVKKILVVADLVDEIKNISGILKAYQPVHNEFPDSELRIIGAGKDETLLKHLAAELGLLNSSVFFDGLKSNAEVYDYLKQCDFLVVNSRFETFSLICAEAMSCGKPVIATRCGGPEELITLQTGTLIPIDDPIQLSAAISNMILHPENFDPEVIRKYAFEKFNPENAATLFENVFCNVLQEKDGS